MTLITLSPNFFLDKYTLNIEFSKKANISPNAYRYWKDIVAAKYEGSRTVFLETKYIPQKYQNITQTCTNLDGFVPASIFCSYTGLASSHLIKSNGSSIYEKLEIKTLHGIKFVNLKRFYDMLGLEYTYNIYIEKCCYFSPAPLEKKVQLTSTMCVGYY